MFHAANIDPSPSICITGSTAAAQTMPLAISHMQKITNTTYNFIIIINYKNKTFF